MKLQPENLLRNSTTFRTRDVGEFHSYVAGFDGVVERQVVEPSPVAIELRHASLGRVDVGLFSSSVTMVVTTQRRQSDDYLLQFPLSCRIDVELDGREYSVVPGHGILISPGVRVRRVGKPGWTLLFGLPAGLVRSRLEERIGRTLKAKLMFQPLITSAAKELRDYGLLVVQAIDCGTATPEGSVADVLQTGLIDLLLSLQPHTYGKAMTTAVAAARSARIGAVEDHLKRHLHETFTVQQLARIAGCSERSLQNAFVQLCGMTPLQFVRRKRLSIARSLLEAGNQRTNVSDAARQTGFAHAARFAAEYKRAYGESPSETLRRVRRKSTS